MGGPKTFEHRLDTMFIANLSTSVRGGNGLGSTLFNPGNEPSFSTPFLYNYLPQRQHKSVQRSKEIIDQYYSDGPSGLPGNSDAGALDNWMIWGMLGLYPVVTQPVYLILRPWFEDISISVGERKTLRITATGLDDERYYVQSLKVNGKQWYQSWLTHDDLVGGSGGRLEFVLGKEPRGWDTGALPPSPGHRSL